MPLKSFGQNKTWPRTLTHTNARTHTILFTFVFDSSSLAATTFFVLRPQITDQHNKEKKERKKQKKNQQHKQRKYKSKKMNHEWERFLCCLSTKFNVLDQCNVRLHMPHEMDKSLMILLLFMDCCIFSYFCLSTSVYFVLFVPAGWMGENASMRETFITTTDSVVE